MNADQIAELLKPYEDQVRTLTVERYNLLAQLKAAQEAQSAASTAAQPEA